jgi:hypothetical protein
MGLASTDPAPTSEDNDVSWFEGVFASNAWGTDLFVRLNVAGRRKQFFDLLVAELLAPGTKDFRGRRPKKCALSFLDGLKQ